MKKIILLVLLAGCSSPPSLIRINPKIKCATYDMYLTEVKITGGQSYSNEVSFNYNSVYNPYQSDIQSSFDSQTITCSLPMNEAQKCELNVIRISSQPILKFNSEISKANQIRGIYLMPKESESEVINKASELFNAEIVKCKNVH